MVVMIKRVGGRGGCSCILENSESKKEHNFVQKNWRITSPNGMGSPFDSKQLL